MTCLLQNILLHTRLEIHYKCVVFNKTGQHLVADTSNWGLKFTIQKKYSNKTDF